MTTTLWVGETRSSPLPDPEKSWHNTMALIDSPWSRLRKPPTIPTGFTAQALNDLDDLAFAELIQAQLVPRDQDVQGRRLWDRFWKVLREDDQLAALAKTKARGSVDGVDAEPLVEAAGRTE